MGMDDKDIHDGCRYVVSCACPSSHVCLVLILSAGPSLSLRPISPSTVHAPALNITYAFNALNHLDCQPRPQAIVCTIVLSSSCMCPRL